MCRGWRGQTPSPAFKSGLIAFCLCLQLLCDDRRHAQLKVLLFFSVFHIFLVPFDSFLTSFDTLCLEESCRIGPVFQRPGVCSVLAVFSDRCLFPALEQHDCRKAKGSMWRVCSKDVEMNHFNQLTFQSGKQTCL